MKTMKVRALKEILASANDEENVVIDDVNYMCIAIVGGGERDDAGIHLRTQQEFPDTWFDRNGDEIDWALHGIERITTPEEDEMYINYADETGGREVYARATFYDGFAEGVGFKLTYPKMSELTPDLFRRIDECCGGRCTDSGCITPQDICVYCGKLVRFGIMDTTNSHNEDLVRQLNIRWVEDWEMFEPIMKALYERDIDEITNSDAFKLKKWEGTPEYALGCASEDWTQYNEMALRDMKERWDAFAENYLMHIADDQDLEAIIKFVRYDRSENA